MDTWKEFDHNVITHSAAHHLMAVDDLIQSLGYARVSDVARVLGITRGSVSISLKPLREAGLLVQDDNKHLKLSDRGRQLVLEEVADAALFLCSDAARYVTGAVLRCDGGQSLAGAGAMAQAFGP